VIPKQIVYTMQRIYIIDHLIIDNIINVPTIYQCPFIRKPFCDTRNIWCIKSIYLGNFYESFIKIM